MKKIIFFLLFLSLLSGSGALAPIAKAAPLNELGELTFADLGLETDMVLHGPYDSVSLRFDLPATWELQEGAELQLEISSLIMGVQNLAQSSFSGATLEVYFNGVFQQSLALLSNEKVSNWISITQEALVSSSETGSHQLSFYLYAEMDCELDYHQTSVVIHSTSKAFFPYEQTSLSLDLRRLPWPIYQQHVKTLDPVHLVIPAEPTADELQAALVVVSTFGRMTNGNLPLTMITTDQLSEAIQAQSHLIVVGKPNAFPMFGSLAFPVQLVGNQYSSPELQENDGIVQILASPWNDTKVILIVSGNTDPGVVKAAQALSTANLQTGMTPDYSIIAQVSPVPSAGTSDAISPSLASPDIKLSDLGYTYITSTGIGSNWLDYKFTIPLGQSPTEESYLDLSLSTSSLVDPNRSEGVVYLNDVQIGSILLTSETSNLATTRINFPLSVLQSGVNTLDLVLNLVPYDVCSVFSFSSLWVTIYSDSVIHLPLIQTPISSVILKDIKAYPYPFVNDPSLSTTTFILPQQDPPSWSLASQVAYDLGTRISGLVLGFEVAFDGQIPDELRTMNLILVGEPRQLGIVSELKDSLPAYYENDSNIAVLDSQQIIYRIASEKSLGYLQLFASPWNGQGTILGIFGTTPEGLASAIHALLDVEIRDAFAGDFVTLDGREAIIVDTQTGIGIGQIVAALNPSVSQIEPTGSPGVSVAQNTSVNIKRLILIGVVIVAALIAAVIFVTLWLRQRRQ